MGDKQRHRQPVHAEGDAAGVQHLAGAVVQAPDFAEMLLVIIEAHAGGRRFVRNAPAPAVRISAHPRAAGRPSWRRPGRRKDRWPPPRCRAGRSASAMPFARSIQGSRNSRICRGRADADIFAHAEALEAVDLARGLMAETVGGNVEDIAVIGHDAARRRRWDRPGSRRPAPAPGRMASGLRSSRRLPHACWLNGRFRAPCRSGSKPRRSGWESS